MSFRVDWRLTVQRVWTVLEEKAIPYQYIEVNPYQKPESLLQLNPRGLVPTLEFENKPLFESNVVCEFLEEQYPDHGSKLLPADPFQRAKMRISIDFVTTRIIPSFHRFLQIQPDQASGSIDEVRNEYLKYLKEFASQMDATGPFFTGKEPTLVDFVLAPWAMRNWVFGHFKGGLGIPDGGKGGEDEEIWKRWRSWASAVQERPSLQQTMSEREHYLPIYQR